MYKITWDKETGGVRLHSRIVEGTLGTSPRPVFWEELDLLKLNELGWVYPHCEEPLLWAINKQYWYRGELVFEAKGANIYDDATVVFQDGKEKLKLKPVDVKKMLERCQEDAGAMQGVYVPSRKRSHRVYSRDLRTICWSSKKHSSSSCK